MAAAQRVVRSAEEQRSGSGRHTERDLKQERQRRRQEEAEAARQQSERAASQEQEVWMARVRAVLAAMGNQVVHMGDVGSGQLAKMVNQSCIAGIVQGLSEGVNFATKAGLDADQVIAVISKGAAQSWQMENRAKTMLANEFDFGFAVDWMRKDLGIALSTAKQINARLPLTALVDQFYADVQNAGGGRWDTSSLLRRLK